MLIQLLNLLEGLEALVGQDEFKKRYPEFVIAVSKIKVRIRGKYKLLQLLNPVEELADSVNKDKFKGRCQEFAIAVGQIRRRIRSAYGKARLASYRLG